MSSDSSPQPSGSQVISQSKDPWSGAQSYLTTGFERAKTDILDKPSQYYPNSTVVPFSNQTEQALNSMEARATAPSPVLSNAINAVSETAAGDYLGSNPNFDAAMAAASRPLTQAYQTQVQPGIDARFSASGRLGGAARNVANDTANMSYMNAIGDQAAKLGYQNYSDERTNQLKAAMLAPTMYQAQYAPDQQLAQVGGARESQAKDQLQEQISRYNYNQQAPKDALSQFMALINGGSTGYGNSTTTQPIYSDPLAQNLGYLSTGTSIAGSLFGNGGVVGGLKNLFG
jgi:hypothetical protein